MKIQYCSDLHMEFRENMRFMKSLPLELVGDVLVIAGDVGYLADKILPRLNFWKWASENYRQVLMIAGNHEFYNNGDIAAQGERWQKMFLSNVGYYHNKVVRIDNIDFILSTLWSRIPPVDELAIREGMNDYSQIFYNKRRLIPQNITDEFEKNFAFIRQAVNESDAEKIVVITHHLPTFSALEQRHAGDILNAAYATELGNYIADSKIAAWICGHSHHPTDMMIGNTRLVSNPLGYIFCGENSGFNDSAVIEV